MDLACKRFESPGYGPVSRLTPPPPLPPPGEQVLKDCDLLSQIFANIELDNEHSRRDFKNLALVCKVFQDLALNFVWRTLASLLPLILLLPSIQKIDGSYLVHEVLGLRNSFKKYANRVREIRISDNDVPLSAPVNPIVYTLLSQQLNGAPLLPHLESIRLASIPEHFSWSLLSLLIPSPSLKAVEIEGSVLDNVDFYRLGLPLLVSRASGSLTSLTLKNEEVAIDPAVWNKIFSFHELKSLSLRLPKSNSIPGDFLLKLGQNMSNLSDLTLDVHFENHIMPSEGMLSPSIESFSSEEYDALFWNLKALTLTNRSATGICQCFSIPSLIDNLTTFTFHLTEETGDSLLGIAYHLRGYAYLRRFELNQAPGVEMDLKADKHLYPLLVLNLEELVVSDALKMAHSEGADSGRCFDGILEGVEDRRCKPDGQTSKSRRYLRMLTLPSTWSVGHVTLAVFQDVARRAPGLWNLGVITIDSSATSPEDLNAPNLGSSSSELRYLEINDVRSEEPDRAFKPKEYQAIARYLDECFPHLISVRLSPSSKEFCFGHWDLIEHLRKLYKVIRLR